jgi:Flp pilus assembly pilin Flp
MSVLSNFRKAGQILKPSLTRLKSDERGALSVETVLMVPLLTFLMIAMFVYYQVFHQDSLLAKSSYTITDIMSREVDPVNQAYIDNMQRLLQTVSNVQSTISFRVALVRFDAADDDMDLLWAARPTGGTIPNYTQGTIDSMRSQIPDMADTDTVLIVETSMPYVPPFLGGSFWMARVPSLNFRNLIVMRTRFTGELCWTPSAVACPVPYTP